MSPDGARPLARKVGGFDEFEFAVEPLKVAEFARAAWDQDPDHRAGRPLPPTFLGAAGQMAGRPHSVFRSGLDLARAFHGEERLMILRAPAIGEVLQVSVDAAELAPVEARRAGQMRRLRFRSVFRAAGEVVAVVDRTLLESGHRLEDGGSPIGLSEERWDRGLEQRADPLPARPRPWTELPAGELVSATFPELTRTDFVRYAGASGDMTAVHYDDLAARNLGAPRAFAMGMLSGAFAGHVLGDAVALDGPYELALRFRDRIWPGDTLAVAAAHDPGSGTVSIECRRANGELVTSARARPLSPEDQAEPR